MTTSKETPVPNAIDAGFDAWWALRYASTKPPPPDALMYWRAGARWQAKLEALASATPEPLTLERVTLKERERITNLIVSRVPLNPSGPASQGIYVALCELIKEIGGTRKEPPTLDELDKLLNSEEEDASEYLRQPPAGGAK